MSENQRINAETQTLEDINSKTGLSFKHMYGGKTVHTPYRRPEHLGLCESQMKNNGLYMWGISFEPSSKIHWVYAGMSASATYIHKRIKDEIYLSQNEERIDKGISSPTQQAPTIIYNFCKDNEIPLFWHFAIHDMRESIQGLKTTVEREKVILPAEDALLAKFDFIGNFDKNIRRRPEDIATLYKSSIQTTYEPSLKDVYRLLSEASVHTDRIAHKQIVVETETDESASIDCEVELKNPSVTNKSRPTMDDYFTDGQQIRFRLKNTVSVATYNSELKCLVQGENKFKSMCEFATKHAREVNPSRTTSVDAWSKCECESSDGWICVRELLSKK